MHYVVMGASMEHKRVINIIPLPNGEQNQILTKEAIDFLYTLEMEFRALRKEKLDARFHKQKAIDSGIFPHFLNETASWRNADWKVSPLPADLQDRRVEITGPVDRKMIINALNSGANIFMADFEDSNAPTWENCIHGQINLIDAVNKTISYVDPKNQKYYALKDKTATLVVRPRGWHLEEKHVMIEGEPVSASIFDFAMYFFHNAKTLISQGTGPYFYLPKMESHLEAALWDAIFTRSESLLQIKHGTIKATVLIETIHAAFEMDEIIYVLKDHIAGLNCGRWDYIFSFIKTFRKHSDYVLPDRQEITMTRDFLKSYVDLLIATCHKRGVHAMGGMAAQIPIQNDEEANNAAMDKVLADKTREVLAGHDGTWVAHPGLIPIALKPFNQYMPTPNQIDVKRPIPHVIEADLLKVPTGNITEEGIKNNLQVGILYLYAWLNGNGCVPINHLMEDAATAEICRSQLWQWLKFRVTLTSGVTFTPEFFAKCMQEVIQNIESQNLAVISSKAFKQAQELFFQMITNESFDEFLTVPAYSLLAPINQEQDYES